MAFENKWVKQCIKVAAMIERFMKETKCKIDAEAKTFLLMKLYKEKKIIQANLLYRGTKHGYKA